MHKCKCNNEILTFNFENIKCLIYGNFGKIRVKINNTVNIFNEIFPNCNYYDDRIISNVPNPLKIMISNNGILLKIKFFKNCILKTMIGINFITWRISLVDEFKHIIPIFPIIHRIDESKHTFFYTGEDQKFLIPHDAKQVIVECWGAGGGSMGNDGTSKIYCTGYGGGGAYMKASLTDLTIKELNIIVGQGGVTSVSSNNTNPIKLYGGAGGQNNKDSGFGGSSGGSRSAIQILINNTYEDIVTAGGGGGGGGNQFSGTGLYVGLGSGASGDLESTNRKSLPAYSGYSGTIYNAGLNGVTQFGSTSNTFNAGKYTGGGGNQCGSGAGSGFYGGGYGGIISFNPYQILEEIKSVLNIKNGLVTWLDASDANTILLTEGTDQIYQWNDKSDLSLQYLPYTGISTYSIDNFNGKQSVTMPISSFSSNLKSGTFNKGMTIITVFSSKSNQEYNTLINRNQGSSATPFISYNIKRVIGTNNSGQMSTVDSYGLESPCDSLILISMMDVENSKFTEITSDGFIMNNNTSMQYYNDLSDEIYIGTNQDKSSRFNGTMSEILIYDRPLQQSEINIIMKYLCEKWSIKNNYNSSHEDKFTLNSPGDYFLIGGGGSGSSFINTDYAKQIISLPGEKRIVGGSKFLPNDVLGRVGDGGVATNKLIGGESGKPGYVIITVKY